MSEQPARRAPEWTMRDGALLQILQAAAVAANPAPTVEDALKATLRSYCAQLRWPAARLAYGARAPLWVRHVEDRARFSGHRGVWESAFPAAGEDVTGLVLVSGRPRVRGATLVFPILEGIDRVGVVEATAQDPLDESPALLDALVHLGTQLGLIAERKRLESEQREGRAFAEQLLENASMLAVHLDLTGRILLFNRSAERVTGYERSEVLGRNWFELLAPRDRYPQIWDSFCKLGAGTLVRSQTAPLLCKDGAEKRIQWRNSEVRRQGLIAGTLWLGAETPLKDDTPSPLRVFGAGAVPAPGAN